MKKGISYLLLLSALFAFSSCGEQPHTHSPSSDWSYDNTSHWHACSGCEELLDKENHKWNDGVETTFATDTDGVITYTCKTCNTTKEEGVSAFSKVGELEQKSWSSFEGFTMYAKRDSYSVNLRFLADNTVFTSLNRNSKLEVYISTGKNVSQLNGNGGVTRITVYSDLKYDVYNYGGKDISQDGIFVTPNIKYKTVIDISFNYGVLDISSDDIIGLSFGLWSENESDWAAMNKLNSTTIAHVEQPSEYVRLDKHGKCFESPINDYPENMPKYNKEELIEGYTYNIANPINIQDDRGDDIYLKVNRTKTGFNFDMIGFGQFLTTEYLKLVLHTSNIDGEAWNIQASDVSFLISQTFAIKKTGSTYFWDFTTFAGASDTLANHTPTFVEDEKGYFTLNFTVDYNEIPEYSSDGEVSFFMFEFNDGFIYNAVPLLSMTKDGVSTGDGATQVSYQVIQERSVSVNKEEILADYNYRFSTDYYGNYDRTQYSLILNFVSFNEFYDNSFIRFVIDVDTLPAEGIWALNAEDVSFTIYKDAAYSSTNKTNFWDGEANHFHDGLPTLNAPVFTQYEDYWTLSLEIEYSEINAYADHETVYKGLFVYFNNVIYNHGFNFDGYVPEDIALQSNYFVIRTYEELQALKDVKGYNYKFSENYFAKIEKTSSSLIVKIRSWNSFLDGNFIRFIIDVDGVPTEALWSIDSNDASIVIDNKQAYITKGYTSFWDDEANNFHNENSLTKSVSIEDGEEYWTLTLEIDYKDIGENLTSSSNLRGLLVAFEGEIINSGFNFNGKVPEDIAYQRDYFNI